MNNYRIQIDKLKSYSATTSDGALNYITLPYCPGCGKYMYGMQLEIELKCNDIPTRLCCKRTISAPAQVSRHDVLKMPSVYRVTSDFKYALSSNFIGGSDAVDITPESLRHAVDISLAALQTAE